MRGIGRPGTNEGPEDLLLDIKEFLLRLQDFLDGQSDVRDGQDGPTANTAMQLLSEIDGNDYQYGLLDRIKKQTDAGW